MSGMSSVFFFQIVEFILTHSIWKSNASKKIGPISTKERQSLEYRQKLVEKWSTAKDVRSVNERRFVPSSIHNTTKLKRDMIEAQKVKEERRRNHSRAGKEKPKAERKSEFGVRYPHSGDRLTIRRDCHQGAEVRGVCCGLWCYPVYVYVHYISRYYNVLHLRFLGAYLSP
jgi:WD repeat and SOF domain-containing protein 1